MTVGEAGGEGGEGGGGERMLFLPTVRTTPKYITK